MPDDILLEHCDITLGGADVQSGTVPAVLRPPSVT
jgi:hypothetical protein